MPVGAGWRAYQQPCGIINTPLDLEPVVVGAVVGWVASLIVKGAGSGLLTDILVGIGGSILASFLLPAIGIQLGGGVIGSFIAAVIGAVILLLIIKLIRKG